MINNPIMQMFGNFQNFQNQFQQFKQQMGKQGGNPQQMVQELLNSGRMTQEQFNQLSAMANMLSGKRM